MRDFEEYLRCGILEHGLVHLARPPLSQERLSLHPDGRVRLGFKAPWKDGTHAVLLDPLDFIARLAAVVPPPRFHLLRYHGVLAARAAARADIVPGREPPSPPPQLPLFQLSDAPLEPPPPSRHPWSWLPRRVFAIEVPVCPAWSTSPPHPTTSRVSWSAAPASAAAASSHRPPGPTPPPVRLSSALSAATHPSVRSTRQRRSDARSSR